MKDESLEQDLAQSRRSSSFIPHPSSFIVHPSSFAVRPTWAEIDLDNLLHNLRVTRESLRSPRAIMAAVKADAYGHGAVQCAKTLERGGVDWFGVALPEEGLELREAGIGLPVLCLGGFWEGQEDLLIQKSLTPVVSCVAGLETLSRAARAKGITLDYHLKVDTGMGRLGVSLNDLDGFLDAAARLSGLRMDGLMTHLASADLPEKAVFTDQQMQAFENTVRKVFDQGHSPRWLHAANGAAMHGFERVPGNMVRIGGLLYGLWRDVINPRFSPLDWRPVMSVRTKIGLIKQVPPRTPLGYGGTFVTDRASLIATLPIGYEDGLRRAFSNCGKVIVRGQIVPIVGRISMDFTLVDVTEVGGVSIGDDVVILGRQGRRELTAEDLAAEIGTISYEITCGLSERVPRLYRGT